MKKKKKHRPKSTAAGKDGEMDRKKPIRRQYFIIIMFCVKKTKKTARNPTCTKNVSDRPCVARVRRP